MLIRQMQSTNVGWGAPRIHGELLKLGIDISQATVSKYMVRQQKPPSQNWRTFLENHADCIAGIDFFTVPTAAFRVLYVFIVLNHDRRRWEMLSRFPMLEAYTIVMAELQHDGKCENN